MNIIGEILEFYLNVFFPILIKVFLVLMYEFFLKVYIRAMTKIN